MIIFISSTEAVLKKNNKSKAILTAWIRMLNLDTDKVLVVTAKTQAKLKKQLTKGSKLVILDKQAEDLLIGLGLHYVTLPTPSPLNRELNNVDYVSTKLLACYRFLNKDYTD